MARAHRSPLRRRRVPVASAALLVGWLAAAAAPAWGPRGEALVWPGSVAALERRLASERVEERRAAAVELARLPAQVQRRLLPPLFSDPDPEVRLAVADAALVIRLPDAGRRASEWLGDPDPRVRQAAAEVLAVMRDAGSLAGLGRVLEDPEASVRAAAATALGNSQSSEATVYLLGHLDDNDPEVRQAVIEALEALGDTRAVVPLIGRLQEQRAALRRQAAVALGRLRDARAASALVVALADADASVRAAAATALGQIRAQDAVWSLGALLESEVDPAVQEAALDALGAIASQESIDGILRSAAAERWPRHRVERALRRAGAAALPSLERCVLTPAHVEVAEICLSVAAALGGERATSLIERALQAGAVSNTAALDALGRAGEVRQLPAVLEHLTASDPAERRAAIDAAARLLDPARPTGGAIDPILLALDRARGSRFEQVALLALLGRTGSPRAASSLAPYARSSDALLRATALEALGHVGRSGADAVLLEALDSDHFPTRWTAALALRRAGGRASLDTLLERMEAGGAHRDLFAVALPGPLLDGPSPPQLERLGRLLLSSPGALKDALIEAYGRLPGDVGSARLVAMAKRFGAATRAKIAEALGSHPEARGTLVELTRDADAAVRSNAAWSLGLVGEGSDLARVRALVADSDIAVAANAVAALALAAKRTSTDAGDALCRALEDDRSYVQANALSGLRLTGASCERRNLPAWLLEHHPSEEVRLAAARLLGESPTWHDAATARQLERCAAKDVSGRVAAACATLPRPEPPAPSESE